jgi:hypothetical protein
LKVNKSLFFALEIIQKFPISPFYPSRARPIIKINKRCICTGRRNYQRVEHGEGKADMYRGQGVGGKRGKAGYNDHGIAIKLTESGERETEVGNTEVWRRADRRGERYESLDFAKHLVELINLHRLRVLQLSP